MNEKIYELEKQIEQMKNELETLQKKVKQEIHISFEDDPIFLLSREEYERYKLKIPHINTSWWLRTPGIGSKYVAGVIYTGNVYDGYRVDNDLCAVLPVLKYDIGIYCEANPERFFDLGVTWTIIDKEKGLAIAEMPIMFSRFDAESNDYATSEVRKKLLDWYKERIEW